MGKKGDLSVMVMGSGGLVWVFQKLLIYLAFPTQPSVWLSDLKKRKHPLSCSSLGKNYILRSEKNGQCVLIYRKGNSNSNKYLIEPRYAEEHTLKHMGRRPHGVLFLSARICTGWPKLENRRLEKIARFVPLRCLLRVFCLFFCKRNLIF